MTEITFPAILQQERERLGWTRKKMSEKTGIPARTIQTWEHGTEPALYIRKYVLAELREEGRSSYTFFDMINVLRECEEYLDGINSILHQKIKQVLDGR
ncbi:helix-turn-helix transcriptional regulator [Candidatus Pacearchaeota archaeon]|nr:helix-turn-helix transcriptional regulator [Candidatus Pacearchaeota archaeon]